MTTDDLFLELKNKIDEYECTKNIHALFEMQSELKYKLKRTQEEIKSKEMCIKGNPVVSKSFYDVYASSLIVVDQYCAKFELMYLHSIELALERATKYITLKTSLYNKQDYPMFPLW